MSSESPGDSSRARSWLERLMGSTAAEPQDRAELLQLLRAARGRALLDIDALTMIEGVLGVSEMRVRDIMIPRGQTTVIERDMPLSVILPIVIESAHSRFPVIDEDPGQVIGILLAKDLLQYFGDNGEARFQIRDVLRPAAFVPESKRLNVLLKEFRASRNHMAIVVDEYGSAAGLVTIEDVLEQIVGEIEDEHDFDEGSALLQHSDTEYTAKALLDIEDFNEHFGESFSDDEFETIGGLVTKAIGHLPKRGESVDIGRYRFTVMRADSRRIHLLNIQLLDNDEAGSDSPAA